MRGALGAALVFAVAACAGRRPLPAIHEDQVVLPFGQPTRLPGRDESADFSVVRADARCPEGATCARPGEASIVIVVARGPTEKTPLTLSTDPNRGSSGDAYNVHVRLVRLDPRPSPRFPVRPADYRATILVSSLYDGDGR